MSAPLADVQGGSDERGVALARAGIAGLRLPFNFAEPDGSASATVATASAWASVPAEQRGAHMSRLAESLGELGAAAGGVSLAKLASWLGALVATMAAPRAGVELAFPLFWRRPAPVSGRPSWIDYEVKLVGSCAAAAPAELFAEVSVPATTLCPCSKEISATGAHSQRARVSAKVAVGDPPPALAALAAELQACASAPVDAVVKRVDEKGLTEAAYANPRFVEDVVREAARRLAAAGHASWEVRVRNMESIHSHDAFAAASSA